MVDSYKQSVYRPKTQARMIRWRAGRYCSAIATLLCGLGRGQGPSYSAEMELCGSGFSRDALASISSRLKRSAAQPLPQK